MKKYKGAIITFAILLALANLIALLVGNQYATATIVTLLTSLIYITVFGHAIRKSQ